MILLMRLDEPRHKMLCTNSQILIPKLQPFYGFCSRKVSFVVLKTSTTHIMAKKLCRINTMMKRVMTKI